MSKIRINDLARELEVKSKAILDALTDRQVTEKKTHSSSLEDHEAEKVRAHIRGSSETQSSRLPVLGPRSPSRTEEEIKTKIDLSHISRPGDVLKAITQKKEAAAAPARPAAPAVAAKPVCVVPPPLPPRPTPPPVAPVRSACGFTTAVTAPAPTPAARRQRWLRQSLRSPQLRLRLRAAVQAPTVTAPPPRPAMPAPPTVIRPSAPAAPSITASTTAQPPVLAPRPPCAARGYGTSTRPPAPRMIVPQTSSRPVYKAPPPRPVAPISQTSAPAGTMRPAPGRPVPGQPHSPQRPRPAGARRRSAASLAPR